MNGICTHSELIDSIMRDLNSLMRFHMIGEHVMACAIMTGVSQKLMKLKEGVANDLKNREETIEQLKEELRACGREVIDIPANEFGKDQK